jgi:hypothetical protein
LVEEAGVREHRRVSRLCQSQEGGRAMIRLHRSSYLELPEYGAVRARVRRASYRWRELYHTAIQRFGETNAWRASKFFSVEHLASGKTHERSPNFSYDHHMLDHLVTFAAIENR